MFNRSNTEWCVVLPTPRLTVWFVTSEPFAVQIKYVMQSQNTNLNRASRFEARNIATATMESECLPVPVHFAEMGLVPKKNKVVFTPKKDGAAKIRRNDAETLRPIKRGKSRVDKSLTHTPLVITQFSIEAASASSVKLAADFTNWEKSPVELVKSEHGIWHTAVPLPPGDHPYRYIVDGKWCDDPHSDRAIPNPFGTVNAVISVAAR